MSTFSLTTVFVVPVGNTLPTTGSTQNLTDGQFGVFKDAARTIATNGNIATAKFIQFFQGQPSLGIGSKQSDKIKSTKVKQWYKVTGSSTQADEIWEFSDFVGQCDETVTFTINAHSQYLDTISFNGLTRSVTVKLPCCECGDDPCTDIANETIIDLILTNIGQQTAVQTADNALTIGSFFTFEKQGTGVDAVLRVTSKTLAEYSKFCDIALNPYEYDRIWFRGWVYTGPETTIDFLVYDACDLAATGVVVQRSSYPRGTSDQILQLEIDHQSYQSPQKHLFRFSGYNQYYNSYVTDAQLYDLYVIIFDEYQQDDAWSANTQEDETVILAIPQGSTSTIETMLVTYLGAVDNNSATNISTTTTTSTTSTSTTSTTTLLP